MKKKNILFGLLLSIGFSAIAQTNAKGVLLILQNQYRYLRVACYDKQLAHSTIELEKNQADTLFIEQEQISSIDGLATFVGQRGTFRLLTLPGDSIVVAADKAGNISIRFLNKSELHRLRQQELDKWPTVVDDSYMALIKKYRQQKDLPNLLAAFAEGHEKRQSDWAAMYKNYAQHPYAQTEQALAASRKTYHFFDESQRMGNLDTAAINRFVDSFVTHCNHPLLIDLPITSNALFNVLYKISKQYPAYYTNTYRFNYVAKNLQPGLLQNNMLLGCVKGSKTPQRYDSLSAICKQLYPDKRTEAVLDKYRKLRFLNLNSQTSCSVADTAGNIIPFDSLVAQYRGRPIYIDFWASWCAPCLAEMPKSQKLRQQYAGKVQFLYISVDDRAEQWLGGLKRNRLQPAGHYQLPDGLFVYKGAKLHITGVPRHILIDAEGNIVDDQAPRPGDRVLPGALNSLVK
jgi:thiol-disulfide isomerase/thioredoxin